MSSPIRDQETISRYYTALLNKDSDYLGIFYAAVKTTNVFCIATCRARKPKRENVDFYPDLSSVFAAGFRPCKICRPTEHAAAPPPVFQRAIARIRQHPKEKLRDGDLRHMGISPEALRRWFQRHYGMTFHAYQRMYRINLAYEELTMGKTSTDIAADSSYDSASGFAYTYKKLLGNAPQASKSQPPLRIDRLTTPLGPMFIAASDHGICLLEFHNRRALENELADLQKRLNTTIIAGENAHIRQAKSELDAYFKGTLTKFTVALHTPGSDFQQAVWQCLQTIPYGKTCSYAEQAQRIGRPTAVRAVANANGQNRISIIIPCHRVIGSNGTLTGYGGGLERKRWLLDHERRHVK